MAITIAGTGSNITFSNSTVQGSSGKIINFQRAIWDRRTVVLGSIFSWDSAVLWAPIITKTQRNSNLLVKVNLSMRTNYSDCLDWGIQYGTNQTIYQGTQPYDAGFSANSRPYHSVFYITGDTQVGSLPMRLFWRTANFQGGNSPADNINPNYRDDNRYDQEYSQMVVFEIAP